MTLWELQPLDIARCNLVLLAFRLPLNGKKKWESLDIQGKSENCMYLFLCEDYFILNRWRKRTREREKKKKRVFLVIFEKYLFEKLVLKQQKVNLNFDIFFRVNYDYPET